MTHPTDDSLKPCPFCGGAASLHPRTCDKNTPYNPADRAFPIARCGQCGAEALGKDWGKPETAAEKWNTRALLAEQARTEPDLAPGVMRCARCKFRLHRINLNVNVGTVTAGDNKTEPCPNGCGPLWPVTWKEEAEEAMAVAEGLCDRAVAAEKELADLRERLGPRAAQPLKAEQAKDAAEDAPTDAMVDAYLTAQRAAVEEADRFGRPNVGGLHTNTVREACRAGLRAARAAERKA